MNQSQTHVVIKNLVISNANLQNCNVYIQGGNGSQLAANLQNNEQSYPASDRVQTKSDNRNGFTEKLLNNNGLINEPSEMGTNSREALTENKREERQPGALTPRRATTANLAIKRRTESANKYSSNKRKEAASNLKASQGSGAVRRKENPDT